MACRQVENISLEVRDGADSAAIAQFAAQNGMSHGEAALRLRLNRIDKALRSLRKKGGCGKDVQRFMSQRRIGTR